MTFHLIVGCVQRARVLAVLLVGLFASHVALANTAPNISGTPTTSVTVGQRYYFRADASDADGNRLRYAIANKPSWASFSSGRLYGRPTRAGTWTNIVISVSDGRLRASLPAFAITVTSAGNQAPTISGAPGTSAKVGVAYGFQPKASDPNGDNLAFGIQNKPTWATFSTVTGSLSGTPTAAATYPGIVISVSDGSSTAALPMFAITVAASSGVLVPANTAPAISGTPTTSLTVGSAYSFRPSSSDANGDALTFSIANKPAWATFSTTTGLLSGTPSTSQAGTYSNILVSVSDGKASASLPAFAITVTQSVLSSVTLSWVPPTQNTDGTAIANLAGYRIDYGTSPTALTQVVQIANPSISTYVIENLPPATYYFAVRAYSSTGAQSVESNLASKTIQ